MTPNRHNGHRHMNIQMLRATGLGILLLAASCSSMPGGSPQTDATQSVFEAAYRNIDSRYVDDISLETLALAGFQSVLNGLPDASLVRTRATIALARNGAQVAVWPMPAIHDHAGWSALSARFLAAAGENWPALAEQDRDETLSTFFRGALSGLDRYTRYETPQNALNTRARREGFGGLGITIRHERGSTFVRDVHRDTPSEKAGLKAGDRITHIGNEPLDGLDQNDVVARLRGPVHSTADLTIARSGAAEPLKVSVVRAHIILPTVSASRSGSILTLKITGFNQGTARSLGREMTIAERDSGPPIKGIILDLRSNPGGLLDQAVTVSDFFLNDGRIISTRGRHRGANQTFDASWGERATNLPIALLVNGRSASASEIVAAALRDRGRAVVIGTSSFGKGSVQTIVRLPNGGELTMTWAHMIAPSGFSLQDHGIIPAICTVAAKPALGELLSAVRGTERRQGALVFGTMLASRHAVRTDPAKAREACPPSREEQDGDAEIARYILENKTLYTRALAEGGPAIALGG
ncbi:MAG: S41 family peptidase [Rhodospirillaceae bacterium]